MPAESPTTVFHLPGGVSSAGSARGATPVSTAGASAADAPRRAGRSTRDDATSPTVDGAEGRTTWLPRPDDRSLDPAVCPFLRAAVDGDLSAPIEAPDPANRCAALREVVPQSRRQQELVCLTSGHVNCPRYLRGSAVTPEAARPVVRPRSSLSPAVIASLLVVIIAFSASVAFVVGRGGIALQAVVPDASASPSSVAAASPSIAPTASGSTQPSATPTPTVSPTAEPTPTPTPTPKPTPSPTATATATPRPTSNRYELLTACPNTPRCWIYRVRSGDNLFSIANYFGVSLDSIYDRNPWLRNTGLRQGQELRLPPPTR
ncbi:MAG: LysM peptidoglycan-binding domain-containing protein [Candidatus Limnocylindrales bacterium]